jgi:hypothetical protein
MNIWSYSISITLGIPSSVLRSRSTSWSPVSKVPMENYPVENTCVFQMSPLWFQIFAVYHFLGSSFSFLPYLVVFLVSFCNCFFFSPRLSYLPIPMPTVFFFSSFFVFLAPMYVVFSSSLSFFFFFLLVASP